jgi:hypothetical protein
MGESPLITPTMTITACAATILEQIGGAPRLQAMLGTRKVLCSDQAITFDFKMCRRANHCRITYCPGSDLYSVEFLRVGPKTGCRTISTHAGIYADCLRRLFESETGLRMSL